MIIATVVPNNYSMPFDCVKCWLNLPQQYSFDFMTGPVIYSNRNTIVENAIVEDDDVLFIDSDIIFTDEDVYKIAKHLKNEIEAVTGVYPLVHGNETVPCIFDESFTQCPAPEHMSKISACGAGFLGISKETLKAIGPEAFTPTKLDDETLGEDISFCYRLLEKEISLWCDPSIKLGHVRLTTHHA